MLTFVVWQVYISAFPAGKWMKKSVISQPSVNTAYMHFWFFISDKKIEITGASKSSTSANLSQTNYLFLEKAHCLINYGI